MAKKIALLLGAAFALHSAPVGNTSAPDILCKGLFPSSYNAFNWRLGYEGDFVTDGKMNQYNQGSGRIDNFKQWTNSGTLTLNILERMDVYGVFGASRMEADWRFEEAEIISRIKLETENNFLWAVGSRVILCEWCHLSLGCGGRYSSCHYQPSALFSNGVGSNVSNAHCQWSEWQINADISYKIQIFTPYVGVKYDKVQTELNGFTTPISSSGTGSNSFENRTTVGVYIGCALSTGHYFMFNLEGRLVDEEAITVSGDFRF